MDHLRLETFLDPLEHLWKIVKPALFGDFWSKGPFLTPAPCAHYGRIAMIETASVQVGICQKDYEFTK